MVCVCISLTGCTSKDEFEALKTEVSNINDHLVTVAEENDALKLELEALTVELNTLKSDTSDKFELLETAVTATMTKDMAYISIDEDGYDIAETNVGPLLIYVDNVVKEGNGCKVKLVIGNPNYATINGAKLYIECSKTPFGLDKEVDLSIDKTIRSGSWNTVYVTVPYVEMENMTYMSIGVETDSVSLKK